MSEEAPTRAYNPHITIGMPVGSGSLPWATVVSLLDTLFVCKEEGLKVRLEAVVGNSVVTWARSAIVDSFLKSDSTHLFWIDSDIVWRPADFFRLVGLARALPAVGATYPYKRAPLTYLVNHVGEPGQYEVNGLGCIKIRGMGLGFFVVQRDVVERVAASKPKRIDPITKQQYADVFRIDHEGEDIAFMTDIRAAGYDVWLDPSISLGHIGPMIFKGDVIEAFGLSHLTKELKEKAAWAGTTTVK